MSKSPLPGDAPLPPESQASGSAPPATSRPSWQYISALAALLVLLIGGIVFADWWSAYPEDAVPQFVGRKKCVECHQAQAAAFVGSHHERAMDHAHAQSVRGDFNNVAFTHQGITSRMFMKGDKYFMHTEGPDGRLADFEIKYTFGWEPLQQYMVEFDRGPDQPADELARLQVLRVAWDTNKKEWIYIPAPDVTERLLPGDDLHWTGVAQRWNNMCADCHSTGLQKKFDVETARYHTTYHEINVSCEACHGPGSLHVEMAESKSLFWDRHWGYGLAKLKGTDSTTEIETCAKCHSRRNVVATNFRPGQPYHDFYSQELLTPSSYFPDGQILDEVFEHGSFTQSKMFHKGIRCTDCHDPHTTKLKHEGNKLCTSCHQHPAGKYDTPNHHHHKADSTGSKCVDCHMPHRTYMEVDVRRDHSLRVPRPDISLLTGSPNACTGCHLDVSKLTPQKVRLRDYAACLTAASTGNQEVAAELKRLDTWADSKVKEWFPRPVNPSPSFAKELLAAWSEEPEADAALRKIASSALYSAQVRASALVALAPYLRPKNLEAAIELAADPDPSIRGAAISVIAPVVEQACSSLEELSNAPNPEGQNDRAMASMQSTLGRMIDLLSPLLSDPRRSVRIAAARALSPAARNWLGKKDRAVWDLAAEEYRQSLLADNDRAGAHLELGVLAERLGRENEAQELYQIAMKLEPQTTGPRSNLSLLLERMADRLEAQGRQSDAQQLREEVKHYREDELILLSRDVRQLPASAPAVTRGGLLYRQAMALIVTKRLAEAEKPLAEACRARPKSPEFLFALAGLYMKLGRWPQAIAAAKQRAELEPSNQEFAEMVTAIEEEARKAASAGPTPK